MTNNAATNPPSCQPPDLWPDPLPDIIPYGGITLLAGAPGVGKTALLASIARNFRDGRPIFGHQPNPLPAIGIIAADRGWSRGARVWFERAGYPDIRSYSMADDRTFDPRSLRKRFDRAQRLLDFIDKLHLPPGSLVLVDPIALFLGGNLLDYDCCAVGCHEIRAGLMLRQLTLLATAHSAKLRADPKARYLRPQDQILGSTALFGFSDTQMYLGSPEETGESYYTFVWHPHLAKPEAFLLGRDEQGLFVPYDGADQGNCARVMRLFPDDSTEVAFATLAELADALPLSKATLKRVLEVLLERGRIARVGHGKYARVLMH